MSQQQEQIVQPDYQALMISESRDLAALLESLSAEQWDAPSLCAGWRVKDVVAHMAVGHTMPVLGFGAAVARHRFRISAASYALATSFADAHPVDQILALFREGTAARPGAAARFVPIRELFTDHLVHHQDIRRPLGLPRMIPADRLQAALASAADDSAAASAAGGACPACGSWPPTSTSRMARAGRRSTGPRRP